MTPRHHCDLLSRAFVCFVCVYEYEETALKTLGFCMEHIEDEAGWEVGFFLEERAVSNRYLKKIDSDRNKTHKTKKVSKTQISSTETSVRFRPFGYTPTKQAKQTYCFACFVLNVWRTAFSTGRLGRSKNDFSHKNRNSS
jgi:hypothetical protein